MNYELVCYAEPRELGCVTWCHFVYHAIVKLKYTNSSALAEVHRVARLRDLSLTTPGAAPSLVYNEVYHVRRLDYLLTLLLPHLLCICY